MDRAQVSFNYASSCQKIINECGEDYKKGSSLISELDTPDNLHPMLVDIADITYDIADGFRGEDSDKRHWKYTEATIAHFLAGEWEPSAWWAIAVYGIEKDGTVTHSYSVNIQRQGSTTTYESGSERLVSVVKKLADSLDQHQTDEWFMHALLRKLPQEIDDLHLQSTQIEEVTTTDWNELRHG